jgi:hypothetical protein
MLKATVTCDTKTVENMLHDIHNSEIPIQKEYVEKFRKENEGKKVLAVSICYDLKAKTHKCKIEEI